MPDPTLTALDEVIRWSEMQGFLVLTVKRLEEVKAAYVRQRDALREIRELADESAYETGALARGAVQIIARKAAEVLDE